MSSQPIKIEPDVTETNDSDTADSYQVSSTTDVLPKNNGNKYFKVNLFKNISIAQY